MLRLNLNVFLGLISGIIKLCKMDFENGVVERITWKIIDFLKFLTQTFVLVLG